MKYLQSFELFEGKKKKKKKTVDKDQIDPRDKFDASMTANMNPDGIYQMNPLNKKFPYHI